MHTAKVYMTTLFVFFLSIVCFAQTKAAAKRTYIRKEGKFVPSPTLLYAVNNKDIVNDYASFSSANFEVPETNLHVDKKSIIDSSLKADAPFTIYPSTIQTDTSGVSLYVGVLRYKNAVIDICPLPKNLLSFDYEVSFASLCFRIPQSKISGEDVFELITKYKFQLKDGFLMKQIYLGGGKIDLPEYLNLKVEAVTLK